MWIGFFCYPCKIGPVGIAPRGTPGTHRETCKTCGAPMTAVWGPGDPPKPRTALPENVIPLRRAA